MRCALAEQSNTFGAFGINSVNGQPLALAPVRLPTITLSEDADVLVTGVIPLIAYPPVAQNGSFSVLHFGLFDAVTLDYHGWAVTRENGVGLADRMQFVNTIRLARGRHDLQLAVRRYDVAAAGPTTISGTNDRGEALPITLTAVVLDSLSSFDRTIRSQWLPNGAQTIPVGGAPIDMNFAQNLALPVNQEGFVLATMQSAAGGRCPRWEMQLNNTPVAIGAAQYDNLVSSHAMMALRTGIMGGTATLTGRVTRLVYIDGFGDGRAPVSFAEPTFGFPQAGVTPILPVIASLNTFRRGARIAQGNMTNTASFVVGPPVVNGPTNVFVDLPGRPVNPPFQPPIVTSLLHLVEARRVFVFGQVTAALLFSNGNTGFVRMIARNGGSVVPVATAIVLNSHPQNSNGSTVAGIVTLPAGDWEIVMQMRNLANESALVLGPREELSETFVNPVRLNVGAITLE